MHYVWQFLDTMAVKYLEYRYARVHRTGPVRLRSLWDWRKPMSDARGRHDHDSSTSKD